MADGEQHPASALGVPPQSTSARRETRSISTAITTSSGSRKIAIAAPRPDVAAEHAVLEGEAGEHVRAVVRAAAGQEVDDAHVGEREDDAEQERHGEDRQHHRQRDLEGLGERPGAVDVGGLVHLGRDGAEPGEQDHRRERQHPPDVDRDDRDHPERRVAEPVVPLAGAEPAR